MDRLTKRYSNGTATLNATPYKMAQETVDIAVRNCEPVAVAVKRLAEYEDVEKQGLLVKLPCKVGDTVYQTDGIRIYESKIKNIIYDTTGIAFNERALGKTIFLTREEAEQALKEAQE